MLYVEIFKMENKKIATGAGITVLALALFFGINALPTDTHFCEAINLTYHCDDLTAYYKLPNGKCWNDIEPNKLCRSGWEEIDWSKNETNSEIKGIPIRGEQTYLLCEKTNKFIKECQILNSERVVYKVD